jgi:hypothetical protein
MEQKEVCGTQDISGDKQKTTAIIALEPQVQVSGAAIAPIATEVRDSQFPEGWRCNIM